MVFSKDQKLTLVWCLLLLVIFAPSTLVSQAGVINAPSTYEEALLGTNLPILPASGGPLIDGGTATAISGLENLTGPFLGSAPDVGAYQVGLGLPWHGPRSFTDLLAYGLPDGWTVSAVSQLPNYTALGAPGSVPSNSFRLLLTRSSPQAFILVTFEELQGAARWSKLDAIVAGITGDTELVKRVSFRDGLDARIVQRGSNANFLGGRVDAEGVLNVLGGVASGQLSAVQDDFFTFFRSLTYAWYLQDPASPSISMNFNLPTAYGVVPQPAPQAPVINQQPQDQTVQEGALATFTLDVSGLAPIWFDWYKNGKKVSRTFEPSYKTPVTTISDDGDKYKVVVSTIDNVSTTSNEVMLTVTPGPAIPVITKHPQDATALQGNGGLFSVEVLGAAPISFQWQENGVDIPSANSASYIKSGASQTDAGKKYRVIVSTSAGNVTSLEATLSVTSDPPPTPPDSPVVPGMLHGDVTLVSAALTWDVTGDKDKDATATVEYKRQGTSTWRRALDMSRVIYSTTQQKDKIADYLAGSIFRLSPGTTYDVRVVLTDPDGGGATRTTTFTTRSVPKVQTGGRVIEVRTTDDLDSVLATALPGDTFLFHAGTYSSNSNGNLLILDKSGTLQNPILYRAYGDGIVKFETALVTGDHVWVDGITFESSLTTGRVFRTYSPDVENPLLGLSLTRSTVKGGARVVHLDLVEETFTSDNTIIGSGRKVSNEGIEIGRSMRGHVVAFTYITAVYDALSSGQGNMALHNLWLEFLGDDAVEPDRGWDGVGMWEILSWDVGLNGGFSLQPMRGGPWYYFHNQSTGSKGAAFKPRSGGALYVVGNVMVAPKNTPNFHYFFEPGSVWANNYWKVRTLKGGTNDNLAEASLSWIDESKVRLWDHNHYDANPCNTFVHGAWTSTLAKGVEQNSTLGYTGSFSGSCSGGGGGGGGGNSAPVATPRSVIVRVNTARPIQLSGTDADGDPLTYSIFPGSGPDNGKLSDFNPTTGTVTYTPDDGFLGNDSFSFVVNDGKAPSSPAKVSILVVVPEKVNSNGIIGHWKFDEKTGKLAKDFSEFTNDASHIGDPVSDTGQIDGAIKLDGEDDYLSVPDSSKLNITGPISIALWIKSSSLNNNSGGFVSKSSDQQKWGGSAPNRTYELGVRFGNLYFSVSDGTTSDIVSGDERPIIDGSWHHVTAIWDGTNNPESLRIYFDASKTYTETSTITSIQSRDWKLGIGGFGADQLPFNGSIDGLCILDRTLSLGEIAYLASGGSCIEIEDDEGGEDDGDNEGKEDTIAPMAPTDLKLK